MSPRFVLGRENAPCVAEVVNMSLKADCTDFKSCYDSIFLSMLENNDQLQIAADVLMSVHTMHFVIQLYFWL